MIITISGTPGSGKSSVGKLLAKKLDYKHYSMGDLQRKLANKRGMTIKELGDWQKNNPESDKQIDSYQINLGRKKDNFVLDSRLGAKFIPQGINVFLDAHLDERIKRRLNHKREEEKFDDPEETKKDMSEREKTNRERFMKFYSFDFLDMSNYDIIIDTTNLTIEEVVEKILKEIKKIVKKPF